LIDDSSTNQSINQSINIRLMANISSWHWRVFHWRCAL